MRVRAVLGRGVVHTVRRFWPETGRDGEPRIAGQVDVALGEESTVDEARAPILDYHAFAGDFAERLAEAMPTGLATIRDAVAGFPDLGADEVILYCWSPDTRRVEALSEV